MRVRTGRTAPERGPGRPQRGDGTTGRSRRSPAYDRSQGAGNPTGQVCTGSPACISSA